MLGVILLSIIFNSYLLFIGLLMIYLINKVVRYSVSLIVINERELVIIKRSIIFGYRKQRYNRKDISYFFYDKSLSKGLTLWKSLIIKHQKMPLIEITESLEWTKEDILSIKDKLDSYTSNDV